MKTPIINRNTSVPISNQIVDFYKNQISSGNLEAGESLPSIRSLANTVGTSTTTVKRALDSLQKSGYLDKDSKGHLTVAITASACEMRQARWQAFWSYAHEDDQNTHGSISMLMNRICDEFAATTGEPLGVFQDAKDVPWGSDWKQVIEYNLKTTVFFIPILTPTYLHRPNCISELRNAISYLGKAGIENGIFPLLFIDIEKALRSFPDKRVKEYIQRCQYIDCSNLRRVDPDSAEYKCKIGEIVDKMVGMQETLNANQDKLDSQIVKESSSDSPGYLEKYVMLVDAIPKIEKTSSSLTHDLSSIGSIFQRGTDDINKQAQGNKAISSRIIICKRLATDLKQPTSNFNKHCSDLVDAVQMLDTGLPALPGILSFEVADENRAANIESFNNMIDTLQESGDAMFGPVKDFRSQVNQIINLSRDLRPILTSIQESCDLILDLEPTFKSWKTLRISHH